MISLHVQFLLGITLYAMSPKVQGALAKGAEMMGNTIDRFYAIEHGLGMLIAVALVTIGRRSTKKMTDAAQKHKRIMLFYLIGLLIMLATIPWPFMNRIPGAGYF